MNFIKKSFYFFLFIGLVVILIIIAGTPANAYNVNLKYWTLSGTTFTVATSTDFYISCPSGDILNEYYAQFDQTYSGAQTVNFYIQSNFVGSTTITSSQNFAPLGVTGLNIDCSDSPLLLEFDGWTTGSLYFRSVDTNANLLPYGDFYTVDSVSTTTKLFGSQMVLTSGSSSSSTNSTVYIPVTPLLLSAECINGTSSSTCSFVYSTSTATTSPYDSQLNAIVFFLYLVYFLGLILVLRFLFNRYF